jgi:hypothetical protein
VVRLSGGGVRLLFVLGILYHIIMWPVIGTSEALLEREPNAHTHTYTRTARVVWWWCESVQATRTKTMYRERERERCRSMSLSVCVMWSIYIYIYMCEATTNKREYIGVCCWLAGWLAGLGWYRPPRRRRPKPREPSKQASNAH